MRVKLFTFMMASFLITTACGNSSSEAGGDTGDQTGATGEDAGDDTDNGTNGDDASSVDNNDVKDKPLLKSCYKGDTFTCQVEATIVSETNLVRGSSRKALVHDYESSFVARTWSEEQADAGNISHDGFPYERKKVLTAEFPNASWGFFAENVAMMSNRETDAVVIGKKFVEMWKNSSGHLTNMLGNYTYLGVGVTKVGNNVYATQIFH